MQLKTVMPGEKLSTEEELEARYGTFLEDGYIYSYLFGEEIVEGGGVSVKAKQRDIRTFPKRMMILGAVTDDLRTVMFVKIGRHEAGNMVYVALKSGKILAKQDARPPGGYGRRPPERGTAMKPCGVGDIVLAMIIGEDKDTYALGINTPECGVVYAECGMCGNPLSYDSNARALKCSVCKHVEHRKISSLYGKTKEIEDLLDSYPRTE